MLYFDHCASTPPYDEVVDVVAKVMKNYYGNPSSIHHFGVETERLINKSRAVIAEALMIKANEIIFTSGGTESNNLAVKGIAYQFQKRGKHIITTAIEHSSVFQCFEQLQQEGFKVTYLPVDGSGSVNIKDLEQAISKDTILVSMMHVNNEVGSIQPIEEAGKLIKKYPRISFHVDAVQSIGKIKLDIRNWGIDLMSISAHKIRGPKGIGVLYCREGLQLYPILVGGGQERKFRSGTENVPNIIAMAKAIRMMNDERTDNLIQLRKLKEILIDFIATIPDFELNSPQRDGAPHIINFSFPGTQSEVIVHALENYGVIVSTRSACSSGEKRPSRVLMAMGHSNERSVSGLRISLSPKQTVEDIQFLCKQLQKIAEEFKKKR